MRFGWQPGEKTRKFIREVGSVVLGVLIALGLGAIASEIGWRLEVAEAREALSGELGEILGQARERERAEPCFRQRLDALAAILDRAARDGRLPPLGAIGSAPFRTWSRGVWDSTQNAETAAHFDRETLDNLSGTYEFMDIISRSNQRELDLWARLYTMVGPGRPIAADEIAQLRETISETRAMSNLTALAAVRIRQVADAFELPYDRATVTEYGERPLDRLSLCRPILREIPSQYGQAPLEGTSDDARANPITRENKGMTGVKR